MHDFVVVVIVYQSLIGKRASMFVRVCVCVCVCRCVFKVTYKNALASVYDFTKYF